MCVAMTHASVTDVDVNDETVIMNQKRTETYCVPWMLPWCNQDISLA